MEHLLLNWQVKYSQVKFWEQPSHANSGFGFIRTLLRPTMTEEKEILKASRGTVHYMSTEKVLDQGRVLENKKKQRELEALPL